MDKISSKEIRDKFLEFFKENGHMELSDSSIIPKNDPTLLFINSGMAPLKDYFTGAAKPPCKRLCDVQTCIRTIDIDSIGDKHHLTSFQMLGSWSIGDYFKEKAIYFAYTLLTERIKLPKEKIYVSVFSGDEELGIPFDSEAYECWKKVGVDESHIVKCGREDNFWGPTSETGPCGPCTEMFFDTGDGEEYIPGGNFDTTRYIEIWNAGVFMQFSKNADGNFSKLAFNSVDTGAGLERLAMVIGGYSSVYETDLLAPIREKIIAQLDSKLKNGDIVEILTSKHPAPRLDWLNFVVTKQASSKIRQWFKKNKREDHIELGKTTLEHELTKATFDEYIKNGELEKIAKQMNYVSIDDLFAALGYGETTVNKIVNKLRKTEKPTEPKLGHEHRYSKKKDIEGLEGMLYSFARCCSPIPGEPIVGVVTRSKGVSIHRLDCKTLDDIEPERLLDIKWSGISTDKRYTTSIRIETAEKQGLLKDIISAVSDNNTNIVFANVKSRHNKLGIIELGLEVDNIETLKQVMNSLQSMPEVYTVKRVQTAFNQAPKQFAKKNSKSVRKKRTQQNPR